MARHKILRRIFPNQSERDLKSYEAETPSCGAAHGPWDSWPTQRIPLTTLYSMECCLLFHRNVTDRSVVNLGALRGLKPCCTATDALEYSTPQPPAHLLLSCLPVFHYNQERENRHPVFILSFARRFSALCTCSVRRSRVTLEQHALINMAN